MRSVLLLLLPCIPVYIVRQGRPSCSLHAEVGGRGVLLMLLCLLRMLWQDEIGETCVTAVVAVWPSEEGHPEVHFEVGVMLGLSGPCL